MEKQCNIGVIAPDPLLTQLFEEILLESPGRFLLAGGLMEEGVDAARSLLAQGARVLISRGETYRLLRAANLPGVLLELPITVRDVLILINEGCTVSSEIGVVGFGEVFRAAESLASILPVTLRLFQLHEYADVPSAVQEVMASGVQVVVGTPMVVRECEKRGLRGFSLTTRKAVALNILDEADKIARLQRNEARFSLGYEIFSNVLGGEVFFLDNEGKLVPGINSLGSEDKLPPLNARITWAIKNNQPYEGKMQVQGAEVLCHLHPLFSDGKNNGAAMVIEARGDLAPGSRKGKKFVARRTLESIVCASPAMKECLRQARRFAESDAPVCLRGESGVGKDLLAQGIHNASARAAQPFVPINCGALPESLLESEIFGYGEGAFTGARHGGRAGLLEMANGGTVFLDEIGEAPLSFQVALLRFLEDNCIVRIGGEQMLTLDVRVICATNCDLEEKMRQGLFRRDLYYRIHMLPLTVPPLRERPECLSKLIRFFFEDACIQRGRESLRLEPAAEKALRQWAYPGNVRELRNVIFRLVILCEDDCVNAAQARACLAPYNGAKPTAGALHDAELDCIQNVLRECKGNKSRAARRLGISTSTLWRRLRSQ